MLYSVTMQLHIRIGSLFGFLIFISHQFYFKFFLANFYRATRYMLRCGVCLAVCMTVCLSICLSVVINAVNIHVVTYTLQAETHLYLSIKQVGGKCILSRYKLFDEASLIIMWSESLAEADNCNTYSMTVSQATLYICLSVLFTKLQKIPKRINSKLSTEMSLNQILHSIFLEFQRS